MSARAFELEIEHLLRRIGQEFRDDLDRTQRPCAGDDHAKPKPEAQQPFSGRVTMPFAGERGAHRSAARMRPASSSAAKISAMMHSRMALTN